MQGVEAAERRLHGTRNAPHDIYYGAFISWRWLGRFRLGRYFLNRRSRGCVAGRGQRGLVGKDTVQQHALLVGNPVCVSVRGVGGGDSRMGGEHENITAHMNVGLTKRAPRGNYCKISLPAPIFQASLLESAEVNI